MAIRVALTGATGFVGGAIARRLRTDGHQLRLLARAPERIPQELQAEVVAGDLLNAAALDSLVKGADVVIHCAGLTRAANAARYELVNVTGTRRLAHRVVANGKPPVLLVSSLAAREPEVSDYARSKLGGEEAFEETPDLCWTAFRPPAVYGAGADEVLSLLRWMARGIAVVPARPDSRFSLIHVDDFAEAVATWLLEPRRGGIYDIHDQQSDGYSWNEFVGIAQEVLGRTIHLWQPPRRVLDIVAWLNWRLGGDTPALTPDKLSQLRHPDWVCRDKRFSELTGWRPRIQLREGLEALCTAL